MYFLEENDGFLATRGGQVECVVIQDILTVFVCKVDAVSFVVRYNVIVICSF